MNRILYCALFLTIFNCNNERIIQLPEIEYTEITEVLDVSPAYIFYDETQPDSTFFNRRNLIGTTNWLVNVDKRLTLRQAMPHIQFLQKKRTKASMHTNENAKNYFTCNDVSIGNLGFIEFTDVNYLNSDDSIENNSSEVCHLTVLDLFDIQIILNNKDIYKANIDNLDSVLQKSCKDGDKLKTIILTFNKDLIFQDYIDIKYVLRPFKNSISKYEFVFNP